MYEKSNEYMEDKKVKLIFFGLNFLFNYYKFY